MSVSKVLYFLVFMFFLTSCQSDPSKQAENVNSTAKKEKKSVPKSSQSTKKSEVLTPKSPAVMPKSNFSRAEENAKIDYKRINLNLLEALIHEEVNKARKANGAVRLSNDLTLRKAAEDQNFYCIRNTELTHTQSTPGKRTIKDRVQYYGSGYTIMAENLIYEGFTVRRTNGKISDIITPTYRKLAKTMVVNWMKSPGHRANIVEKDLRMVGTAVAYNPENYAVYATQVFGTK